MLPMPTAVTNRSSRTVACPRRGCRGIEPGTAHQPSTGGYSCEVLVGAVGPPAYGPEVDDFERRRRALDENRRRSRVMDGDHSDDEAAGWRCPRCGSDRWVHGRPGGAHGRLLRQCVPCGHFTADVEPDPPAAA